MVQRKVRTRKPTDYRFRVSLVRNVHGDIITDLKDLTPGERNHRVQWLLGFALTQLTQIRNGTAVIAGRPDATGKNGVAANESGGRGGLGEAISEFDADDFHGWPDGTSQTAS